MDWSEMGEKVKSIGIYHPSSSSENFKEKILEFNITNFITHKYLIDGESLKFVQVNINNKPYLRVGCAYHENILKSLLSEFNLKFNTITNRRHNLIPAIKDENYELVGAGRIKPENENFIFYDFSSDYIDYIKGADVNNLEAIFGKDKVMEIEEGSPSPFFLIKI
jgi:hypothetical protein